MDSELRDFLAQRLQDSLQGELAAAVGGHAGHGHEPAHGGNGHQVSATAAAHVGQRRLQGGHRPEHVHLELPSHLGQRGFLEGPLQAVAGVGDDDVQGADAPLDLHDRAGDGVTVRYVQDTAVSMPGPELFEGPQVLLGADGADDGVPGGQGGLGESAPQARADAGDEPVPLLHCSSREVSRGAGSPSSIKVYTVSIFIVTTSILVALTEWNPQAIRVPRTARIGAVKAQQPGRQPRTAPRSSQGHPARA